MDGVGDNIHSHAIHHFWTSAFSNLMAYIKTLWIHNIYLLWVIPSSCQNIE